MLPQKKTSKPQLTVLPKQFVRAISVNIATKLRYTIFLFMQGMRKTTLNLHVVPEVYNASPTLELVMYNPSMTSHVSMTLNTSP